MPLIGASFGGMLEPWIHAFAHWLIFALLVLIGSKMIWGSRRIHDGFIGFLAMALILAVAYWAPLGARFRKNEKLAPESPGAPAA